jgi:hypothetical protein
MNNQGRTRSCNRNRSKPTSFTPRGSKQICIPMTRELYDEIWHDAEPVRALLERLIAESPEVFPDGICAGCIPSGRRTRTRDRGLKRYQAGYTLEMEMAADPWK